MKKINYILTLMLLVTFCACTDDVLVQEVQKAAQVASGEMEVNIGIGVVGATGDTRSFVVGEDTSNPNITSMKLICFDIDGLFVSVKDATVNMTSKTITASVPNNTARIHFVANFDDMVLPSNVSVMRESTLMRNRSMTVDYQHNMTYWGYHKESSVGAMETWLKNEDNTSKVWLLRDRAKLYLSHNGATNIRSIIWTISDGLMRGLIAPRETNDNITNPYTNDYYNPSTNTINLVTTQFTDDDVFKYQVTAPTSWGTAAYQAAGWTSETDAQYLFANRNVRNPVKVVARVTYTDNVVKYHAIKFLKSDYTPVLVKRNEEYTINIEQLPKELGYDTVEEALNATVYSNDRFAHVGKDVFTVTNGERYLTLTEGSIKYFGVADANTAVVSVPFEYVDSEGHGVSGAVFNALWLEKELDNTPDAVENANSEDPADRPQVQYNSSTGIGTITFTRSSVEEDIWKHNELRFICVHSGLYRDIDVYSCAHTFTATLTHQSGTNYQLKVSIPENTPEAFFPQTLRIVSKTLEPISIDYDTSKFARVKVETTAVDGITQSATNSAWNYQARSWNYWYEFPIEYKDTWNSGEYVVNLKDVRSTYQTAPTPSTTNSGLGLFVEMKSTNHSLGSLRAVTP